jgi:nucleotide-binding universal stress UspA family protein
MPQRIVVPLDGSELAERALPYAARLARAVEGRLVLVRVTVFEQEGEAELSAERRDELYLAKMAQTLREAGQQVDTAAEYVLHSVEVAGSLCSVARSREADLIVMSTHGRGGLGRWLYGSVADAVLRESEIPVLLVSPSSERAWPEDRPFRILVPLDGSPLSEQVLGPVTTFADAVRAELLLLQIRTFRVYPAYPEAAVYLPDPELELAEAKNYLESVAERLRVPGRVVETYAELWYAPSMIAAVARERDMDLIAMATHGRGGLARFALGSVATGVLQQATVPTLLVRSSASASQTRDEVHAPPVTAPAGPAVNLSLRPEEVELLHRGLAELAYSEAYAPEVRDPALSLLTQLKQLRGATQANPASTAAADAPVP